MMEILKIVSIVIAFNVLALITFNLILMYNGYREEKENEIFADRVERYCLSKESEGK